MKYSEKWGDNIDNAVELALKELKLSRDQVEITVLEQPSKGFFGIGSRLAKVRVEEKSAPSIPVETPERPAASERPEKHEKTEKPEKKISYEGNKEICIEVCGVDDAEEEKSFRQGASRKERSRRSKLKRSEKKAASAGTETEDLSILSEKPSDLVEDPNNPAKAFLESVAKEMGIDISVKVSKNTDCVYAELDGPDTGAIIGKRGATLDAIQYLASLVVNKDRPGYTRVIVDAENYRGKREKTLEKLAYRLADKAMKTGKTVRLEPMNPYERKVIHTALQKRPEVSTRSEGEEPYRRVIIEALK